MFKRSVFPALPIAERGKKISPHNRHLIRGTFMTGVNILARQLIGVLHQIDTRATSYRCYTFYSFLLVHKGQLLVQVVHINSAVTSTAPH